VNLNGHISFETDLPVYRSNLILPFGYKLLAAFMADVDTRLSGNVYYRCVRVMHSCAAAIMLPVYRLKVIVAVHYSIGGDKFPFSP